jgi:hypothetical protein
LLSYIPDNTINVIHNVFHFLDVVCWPGTNNVGGVGVDKKIVESGHSRLRPSIARKNGIINIFIVPWRDRRKNSR